MNDRTYEGFERLIVIVIAVSFLLTGLGIMMNTGSPAFPLTNHYQGVQTLWPDGDTLIHDWNVLPCSTDDSSWNELDDKIFPGDGDTSCRQANVTGTGSGADKRVFVTLEDFVPPVNGTLDSITNVKADVMTKRVNGDDSLHAGFCSPVNGGPVCASLLLSAPLPDGCVADEIGPGTVSSTYIYLTETWTTCGGGTSNWNVTNVNVFGIGSECYNLGGVAEICRVSALSLNVTFQYSVLSVTPISNLALLLPFSIVAVAVIFVVSYLVWMRKHE